METEQVHEISLEQLFSIKKYLWVLIESYPVPINQAKIANKLDVSRSAVTRIKDSLKTITDTKTLAWDRKLILKKDLDTRMQLFSMFLWLGSPEEFKTYVGSHYFTEMVMGTNIYELITGADTNYSFGQYFSKEDFIWMKKFFLRKFTSSKPIIENDIVIVSNIEKGDIIHEFMWQNLPINLQFLYSMFYDSSLNFLDKETDFLKLLELRDKTFHFLINNKEFYSGILNDFAIVLDAEEAKNQKQIEQALEILFLAFLKKLLNSFSDHVYKEAHEVGIDLNIKYVNLGSIINSV